MLPEHSGSAREFSTVAADAQRRELEVLELGDASVRAVSRDANASDAAGSREALHRWESGALGTRMQGIGGIAEGAPQARGASLCDANAGARQDHGDRSLDRSAWLCSVDAEPGAAARKRSRCRARPGPEGCAKTLCDLATGSCRAEPERVAASASRPANASSSGEARALDESATSAPQLRHACGPRARRIPRLAKSAPQLLQAPYEPIYAVCSSIRSVRSTPSQAALHSFAPPFARREALASRPSHALRRAGARPTRARVRRRSAAPCSDGRPRT